MSEISKKYTICLKFSEKLKQTIKRFHIYDENNGYNVLFITSDDRVYSFGQNSDGCCGLGHNRLVKEPQLIPELCDKNIEQLFIGKNFVVAISHGNQIFGWGRSDKGQLGFIDENQLKKPFMIHSFDNIDLAHISCGSSHCLALTSDGRVYGWGDNAQGQLGFGRTLKGKLSQEPKQLQNLTKFKIKSIQCLANRSYALTTDDKVYSWGSNTGYVLGHELKISGIFEPKSINISNVVSICVSKTNSYFLTNEGLIYFCGKYNNETNGKSHQMLPKLLNSKIKFTSLATIAYNHKRGAIAMAVTDSSVSLLVHNDIGPENYKTLSQFISEKYKVTHKTIDLNDETSREYTSNTSVPLVVSQSKIESPLESRYENRFVEGTKIGEGGFGEVFKAIYKTDQRLYAIKKIVYSEEEDDLEKLKREVKTLMKCQSDYVVKYIDWWPEENKNCFFIQMEFCSDNLQNIIEQKRQCFGRKKLEEMDEIEYFICCQLFKELLECVKYLHELNPQIIHRDLKPANVLINEIPINGRFLKLCDFGLAKFTDTNITMTHTRSQGTSRYMAPEVMEPKNDSTKYNVKADIYSLGKLADDLFDFNISSSEWKSVTGSKFLRPKGEMLIKTVRSMLNLEYKKRPTCAHLLTNAKSWVINKNQFISAIHYERNIQLMKNFENKFFIDYFTANN